MTFRREGPFSRFDHHRPSAARTDPDRGVWYGAPTFAGCVVEVFGDTGVIEPADRMVARAELARDLRLLDLRHRGAMLAGSVAAIAKTADVDLSRQWSRYFYEDPDGRYGPVDGLIYLNAHNDDEALVLFERAEKAIRCPRRRVIRLDDARLRAAVFDAAAANNLDVTPY